MLHLWEDTTQRTLLFTLIKDGDWTQIPPLLGLAMSVSDVISATISPFMSATAVQFMPTLSPLRTINAPTLNVLPSKPSLSLLSGWLQGWCVPLVKTGLLHNDSQTWTPRPDIQCSGPSLVRFSSFPTLPPAGARCHSLLLLAPLANPCGYLCP